MSYTDILQTIGLVIALIGCVPGIYAAYKRRVESKAQLIVTVLGSYFPTTNPDRLNCVVSITPGANEVRICELRCDGRALSLVADLDERSKSDSFHMGKLQSTDALPVSWHVPKSSDCPSKLFASFCITDSNRNNLSQITVVAKLERRLTDRITLHPTRQITIRLKDHKGNAIANAHSMVRL